MSGFGGQPRRTQAVPVQEPVVIGPWPKGINNRAKNDALKADELSKAVGVVVDDVGVLHSAGVLERISSHTGFFYRNEVATVLVKGSTISLFDGAVGRSVELEAKVRCVVPIPEGFIVYAGSALVFVGNALTTYKIGGERAQLSASLQSGGSLPPGSYLVAVCGIGPFGYTHADVGVVVAPESPDGGQWSISVGGGSCTFVSNAGDSTLMACDGYVTEPPVNMEFYPYTGCRATTGSDVMAFVSGRLAVAVGNTVTLTKPFNYQVTDDADAYVFDFDVKYIVGVGNDMYVCGESSVVVVANCMTDSATMGAVLRYRVLPGSALATRAGATLAMTDRGLVLLDQSTVKELNDRVVVDGITAATLIDCGEYAIVGATQEKYQDDLQFMAYVERK